ncbi:SDR family oxidoreductase [Kribbella italica]|uniref:NAD(P)-dependent dehydrogenase (Short-subunit alcohol dehydrogenase family) n=1 Tax=Kribbella italica TaxID=1540520 RepID=A0A7W9JEG2_9ACTN|nr:SDR family oxidoreductase [Kribbella italica]MBB5840608.1 NAD(P)-dependent dehydrogenase (short-subunit alcohol dehydrogenase family) [Kribbella italica]
MRVLVAGSDGGIGSACGDAIRASGGQAYGVDVGSTDVTVPGGAEDAVAQAYDVLGGLDGVVHAIGMSGRRLGDGPVAECTDEAWAEVHRVNHESVFRLLRAALPKLTRGGSVVVVGSALATSLDRDFRTVAYASAKGALIPLVRSAAYDAAPDGVRVNLVAAGLVDTPMARRALESPDIAARMTELMPLGGAASTPQEVAEVVLWLLSAAAGRTTGAVVPVDGGWHLR